MADETLLSQKYDLVKLSVISSTQISNRTSAIITKVETPPSNGRHVVVALSAEQKAANKLISIVEIAKRELATRGTKCFQYNALTSKMIEVERNVKKGSGHQVEDDGRLENGSDSEAAFETMGVGDSTGLKKRLVPVITTYLCTVAVKELKLAYGEQR